LIRPSEGRAIAYVDYSQQEFGIAAALSGDDRMRYAYSSGDPYLTFAKQVGRVPEDATAQSHGAEREQFKSLALGVQYGMGAATLSERLNSSRAHGRLLIELHHDTYPKYWRWNDAAVDRVMLCGLLTAAFGWTIHAGTNINPRSIRNFPLQANGAEMLRLACILAVKAGIQVCAPVHDALLIESSVENIESAVEETQACMLQAALWVLEGFPLRTDAAIVRYPDRYSDKRGKKFWDTVWCLIGEKSQARNDTGGVSPVIHPPI
jgi:DNA polymerase I-like protein with 3'-5' exonuclease and polymerase domains